MLPRKMHDPKVGIVDLHFRFGGLPKCGQWNVYGRNPYHPGDRGALPVLGLRRPWGHPEKVVGAAAGMSGSNFFEPSLPTCSHSRSVTSVPHSFNGEEKNLLSRMWRRLPSLITFFDCSSRACRLLSVTNVISLNNNDYRHDRC